MSDVIDLSAVELGQLDLALGPVQLVDCVGSCLSLVKQRAAEREIEIKIDDMSSIPNIIADERRLKQVVLNLLTNAIKFTEPGGRIRVEAVANPGGGCTFTVRDTGIGMAPELVEEALEVFKRGDEPLIRKAEGAGLGLPLANAIVEAHGGALTIESELGVGTAVTVTLSAPTTGT